MKLFIKLIITFIGIIAFTSCQFTEKINLNEDGSGRYTLRMNMSAMMSAMGEMKDSTSTEDNMEILDTIIELKDLLDEKKDSIANLSIQEQEAIKSIEDFKIHMVVDEKNEKIISDFFYDFNSISELKNIQERITKAQSINDNKTSSTPSNTEVKFSYNGKIFSRKVIEKNLSDEEKEAYKKSLEQSASFLDGSTYKIEYHFPKPIKSTTYKGATFSEDRQTILIDTNMKNIIENPKLLDFEIILE